MPEQNNLISLQVENQLPNELVQNQAPWVFLVSRKSDGEVLQKALSLFGLTQKKLDGEIILFSRADQMNHKQKSLVLFFAGVFIANCEKNVELCLGQYDILGERIKQGDVRTDDVVRSELRSDDFKNWPPQAGRIFIGPAVQTYLSQLDINVSGGYATGAEQGKLLIAHQYPIRKTQSVG